MIHLLNINKQHFKNYIDFNSTLPIEPYQLMYTDNLSDKYNLKNITKYLEYIDINEFDSIAITKNSYNSLTIKNNSDYYLYLNNKNKIEQ